jgi:hypothetical protein
MRSAPWFVTAYAARIEIKCRAKPRRFKLFFVKRSNLLIDNRLMLGRGRGDDHVDGPPAGRWGVIE